MNTIIPIIASVLSKLSIKQSQVKMSDIQKQLKIQDTVVFEIEEGRSVLTDFPFIRNGIKEYVSKKQWCFLVIRVIILASLVLLLTTILLFELWSGNYRIKD